VDIFTVEDPLIAVSTLEVLNTSATARIHIEFHHLSHLEFKLNTRDFWHCKASS